MVFGLTKKLQDELFCVTEERNYFQSKYLEQVNEIAALKEELRKAKREIGKLRGELMESSSELCVEGVDFASPNRSSHTKNRRHDGFQEEKKDSTAEDDENEDEHDSDDEEEEEEEEEEEVDIRQSAEKLLQWASYRSYPRSSSSSVVNSPDQRSVGSVASGPAAAVAESSLLGPMIPSTIESLSLDDANLSQSFSQDSNQQPEGTQPQQA
jgi:hypothetical protein